MLSFISAVNSSSGLNRLIKKDKKAVYPVRSKLYTTLQGEMVYYGKQNSVYQREGQKPQFVSVGVIGFMHRKVPSH